MNTDPEICFECGEGHYAEVFEDYRVELPDSDHFLLPKLRLLRCGHCSKVVVPSDSDALIEKAIDEHSETLSPEEVAAFLRQFGVNQAEAARALGMGEKTVHRWAKGTQRVSRSMGYFLRALMAHEGLFEWIRDRQWREQSDSVEGAQRPLKSRRQRVVYEQPSELQALAINEDAPDKRE